VISLISGGSMVLMPVSTRIASALMSMFSAAQSLAVIATYNGCFLFALGLDSRLMTFYAMTMSLALLVESSIADTLLSEVIDYDELRFGARREGSFVIINSSLTQLNEVLGGILPGLLLSLLGYAGNGGCSCGCGVACPRNLMRWSCPTDIGYACSSALGNQNPPFYGDPHRVPPCTWQNTPTSVGVLLCMTFVPSSLYLFAAFSSSFRAPMRAIEYQLVKRQLQDGKKGRFSFDPTTSQQITRPLDSQAQTVSAIKHFTKEEVTTMLKVKGDVVGRMLCTLIIRRAITGGFISLAFLVIVKNASSPWFLVSVTLCSLVIAFMTMSCFLDSLRAGSLKQNTELVRQFCNLNHFESQFPPRSYEHPPSLLQMTHG